MDEARLKEWVEKVERLGLGWFQDEEVDEFVLGLIAALRDAWRERNEANELFNVAHNEAKNAIARADRAVADHNKLFEDWERCEGEATELKQRAARAEAEVERLRAIVPPRLRWPDGPVPG